MTATNSTVPSNRRLMLAGAASLALLGGLGAVIPMALAETPPYDGKGYIDSTARCTSPDVAVVFGSTASSRIAICRDGDGKYEYRGVRVRDGAKLILPATATGSGGFVAKYDGVTYTVTESALEVSAGGSVLRDEPMVDFHGSIADSAPSTDSSTSSSTSTSTTSTSTSTPTTSTSTAETSATSSASTPTTSIAPLPAEVGGSAASGSDG